jgi:predicted permease
MALLVAAGLFTKSLLNVSKTDLGLKADNVIMFGLSPELNGYDADKSRTFFERAEDALAVLPGVTGVTSGTVPLLAGSNWGNNVAVDGFEAGPDTDTNARFNLVGPQYFQTLGMTMIAGREFTRGDVLAHPRIAVVNEAFAKKFNLGRDAVGRHMGDEGFDGKKDIEIVGLVQNAKYSEVKREVPPQFFRPYRQSKTTGSITFYVRTAADPVPFMANIPKVIAQLDAQLPVENLRTLPQQIRQNVFLDRFISVLSTAFACLATLLAAVGLYGVLAYTVSQRTREFGVRMALGAAPGRVRAMVMRQVGVMTVVGGAIGLAGAIGLGKLSESLLYQLKGSDPLVLAGAAAALALVSLAAGFIPAHRASQVEPMRALRYE